MLNYKKFLNINKCFVLMEIKKNKKSKYIFCLYVREYIYYICIDVYL